MRRENLRNLNGRKALISLQILEQSSQWDGFRHYSQPRNSGDPSNSQDRVFYGGTIKEEIMDTSNYRIGTQSWANEGIAGEATISVSPKSAIIYRYTY